jgi:hypothetical protein
LNEWVKLMLEEVRRKAREREEALQEHRRRESGTPQDTPGQAGRPRPDRAGRD